MHQCGDCPVEISLRGQFFGLARAVERRVELRHRVPNHAGYRPSLHRDFQAGARMLLNIGDFLAAQDVVVIVTDHSDVDYVFLVENSRLIVDTRNAMKGVLAPKAEIVSA